MTTQSRTEQRRERFSSGVFVLAWLLVGIGLRGYAAGSYVFGFDQVQILKQAALIHQGDMTLIGPRTGPAAMFTGPLIYYLNAFWGILLPPTISLVVTALFLAGLTGLALYFLTQKYVDTSKAQLLLMIWASSPFLVSLDRIVWNPNLTVLAGSLVLFPCLSLKRWTFKEILLVSLGLWISYQAHFSGFLLVPLAFIGMIRPYRAHVWPMWWWSIPILALISSLLPTIWFDVRNDWLNTRGLLALLTSSDRVSAYMLPERLLHKLFVIVESMGKIWWLTNQTLWLTVAGLTALGVGLWVVARQSKSQSLLLGGWLMFLAIGLSLYRESTPEYYFLLGMPVWLMLWSVLFEKTGYWRRWLGIGLGLYSLLVGISLYSPHKQMGMTIGIQQDAAAIIRELANDNPVAEVRFDMVSVDALGLVYLLEQEPWREASKGGVLHVVYPLKETDFYARKVAATVGIWVEKEMSRVSKSWSVYPFMLYLPIQIQALEEVWPPDDVDRQWQLVDEDGRTLATLSFFRKMTEEQATLWQQTAWKEEEIDGWMVPERTDDRRLYRKYNTSLLELTPLIESNLSVHVVDLGAI